MEKAGVDILGWTKAVRRADWKAGRWARGTTWAAERAARRRAVRYIVEGVLCVV